MNDLCKPRVRSSHSTSKAILERISQLLAWQCSPARQYPDGAAIPIRMASAAIDNSIAPIHPAKYRPSETEGIGTEGYQR
jgi:hypothetical protein